MGRYGPRRWRENPDTPTGPKQQFHRTEAGCVAALTALEAPFTAERPGYTVAIDTLTRFRTSITKRR